MCTILANREPHKHLHGHSFRVLAVGTGAWDGTVTNPQNPMRRDVAVLPAGTAQVPGYLVLQIDADNPGGKRAPKPLSPSLVGS